jgi:hypothetical protein
MKPGDCPWHLSFVKKGRVSDLSLQRNRLAEPHERLDAPFANIHQKRSRGMRSIEALR